MALDLGRYFSDVLTETTHKLESAGLRASFVRAEQAHLTLAFFKEISERNAERLSKELTEKLAMCPLILSVSLGGLGVFPDRKKPRVIWLEIIESAGSLVRLKDIVDGILNSLQLPVEDRPFKPHLTIARIRKRHDAFIPESMFSLAPAPAGLKNVTVQEVSLFKSELTPSGPKYSVLYRIPLS